MIEVKGSNIKMTQTSCITIKDAQGGNYTVNAYDIKLTTAEGDEDTLHNKGGDIK